MEYNRMNIRNTVHNLIKYFKLQNETPSREEIAEVWNKIQEGIDKKKKKRVRKYILTATASAAAFIGCLWLGIEWYSFNNKPDISIIAAQMSNETTEAKDIRLIVSQEEVFHVERGSTVTYSKNGTVSVNEKKVSKTTAEEDSYNQLIVPKGKYARLILADGSSLHVNAGTKVVYPKNFEKNKREIFVDGEIFIDVRRDESAPFIVKTAQFEVQVLGTAFDIKAYSDTFEDAEVVLVRGKVNVKSKSGKELALSPDNKATISPDGLIEKSSINAKEYILWTQGIMLLNDNPLDVIFTNLSRYYGIDIHYTEDISKIKITGKIDLECGIGEVLKRMSAIGEFSFSKQENTYMIEPLKVIAQ